MANETKNTDSVTNEDKTVPPLTWAENEEAWEDEDATWQGWSNEDKN